MSATQNCVSTVVPDCRPPAKRVREPRKPCVLRVSRCMIDARVNSPLALLYEYVSVCVCCVD